MAREQDMLGMATTTGGMAMVPTFGTKPLLGLNAMSFAAPTAENPPFVYDASPSVVAGNKITLAKRLG
jgi:LDH2 family malate/lactate/ureidoglycolate dehydrogenase